MRGLLESHSNAHGFFRGKFFSERFPFCGFFGAFPDSFCTGWFSHFLLLLMSSTHPRWKYPDERYSLVMVRQVLHNPLRFSFLFFSDESEQTVKIFRKSDFARLFFFDFYSNLNYTQL